MPITGTWFDAEHTIVITRFVGHWTITELVAYLEETATWKTGQGIAPIYFINDFTQSATIPSGFLSAIPRLRVFISSEKGLDVLIGASSLVRVLSNTLRRLGLNSTIVFADDLNSAYQIIEDHRSR